MTSQISNPVTKANSFSINQLTFQIQESIVSHLNTTKLCNNWSFDQSINSRLNTTKLCNNWSFDISTGPLTNQKFVITLQAMCGLVKHCLFKIITWHIACVSCYHHLSVRPIALVLQETSVRPIALATDLKNHTLPTLQAKSTTNDFMSIFLYFVNL